ncbi:MAG: aminotransferase class V-fold PLP-dependent enzyme [Clostridium butyricum]|nr:aminotransferase class V-fold PLP-dependent enzyme [Clostridium butyricum]
MDIKRNVLLNPGPATTTDSVKMAQVVPDICPREQEFGEVMEYVSKGLTRIVGSNDEYTTVLFGGSGTAAVESIISSVVRNDEIIFIINNGAYGERMCQMADIYGLKYIEFKSSKIERVNLESIEQIIRKINLSISNTDKNNNSELNDKVLKENVILHNFNSDDFEKYNIKYLSVVHHETTTGLLNDIKAIGMLCEKYEINMIVDAMSSFSGIPIDMKNMNIKYLASSSNKCIQGMAGISFVIANKKSLDEIKDIKPRNLYLNLYKQYLFFKDNYQMRFTPPVQVLYALKQAIIETENETVEKRNRRYKECCSILWNGLDELNLKRLVSDEDSSKLLTSIIEPDNEKYDFNEFHDYLREKGFTIYPGKISSKNTFRIANIGDIYPEDMIKLVEIMKEYFLDNK